MTGKDYLKQLTKDGTKVIFTAADVIDAFEAGKNESFDDKLSAVHEDVKQIFGKVKFMNEYSKNVTIEPA